MFLVSFPQSLSIQSLKTNAVGARAQRRSIRQLCAARLTWNLSARLEVDWRRLLPPRRPVGDWELKREIGKPDVDLRVLIGSRVESRNETVFGVIVGVVTLAFLAPALAEASAVQGAQGLQNAVAVTSLGGMGLWAFDTLALRGRIASWVQRKWFTNPKRVAIHEAGHVMMSHLLGYSLEDYALGGQLNGRFSGVTGVVLKEQQSRETSSVSFSESFAMIALSGIAAEAIVFGDAEGGVEDLAALSRYFHQNEPFLNTDVQASVRWAMLAALRVCSTYRAQLEEIAKALLAGKSSLQCIELLDNRAAAFSDK